MVTYAPYFISTVVVVSMMMLFFAPRIGIASRVLEPLGLGGLDVMGSEAAFRHLYVWSDIWQTAGYSAVIYMAALAGIDPALYDAAKVDGASRLQRIRHVDIPAILPTCAVVLILGVGNLMAVGFEKAFLLQNPLNFGSSEIISTYIYKIGLLNADFGLATAVGLFNAVVNLALLVVVNAIVKRIGGSSLW
jgi:putative aldouronate transport system permease protein